ncbi:MAG: hypothetical protein ATN31_10160 [Candidatus Epulonipiscioides saccharophilum]|nr:MAG: hypothetical protein ATN31_10160 [Epulopiscium sp. AS2M-Bin001]
MDISLVSTLPITFTEMKEAYDSLADDLSRQIFNKRIQFAYTQTEQSKFELGSLSTYEYPPIFNDIVFLKHWEPYQKAIANLANPKIIIYGCGQFGQAIFHMLKNIKEIIFCAQSYKETPFIEDCPVISPQQLIKDFSNLPIIIASMDYFEDIIDFLISKGIDKNNIISYFSTNILIPSLQTVSFQEKLAKYIDPFIIIYNYTKNGSLIFEYIENIDTDTCFINNRFEIGSIFGKNIMSSKDFLDYYSNSSIILSLKEFAMDFLLIDFLRFNQINMHNILYYFDFQKVQKAQYFDENIIHFNNNEVFVDVGVLNGITSIIFAQKANYIYKKIYLFEPATQSANITQLILDSYNIKNFELFNIGLWNKKDILQFQICNNAGANHIDSSGDVVIDVDTLDNIFINTSTHREIPTFIKMDIEGAELAALQGGEQLIRKYKPKLAICVYHKLEDVIIILNWIKSINPAYIFYLRHYSLFAGETVLYCV